MNQSRAFGRTGPSEADGADLPIAALHQLPHRGAWQAGYRVRVSRLWKANPEREKCHPVGWVKNRDWRDREFMPPALIGGMVVVVDCYCHNQDLSSIPVVIAHCTLAE